VIAILNASSGIYGFVLRRAVYFHNTSTASWILTMEIGAKRSKNMTERKGVCTVKRYSSTMP
jgi:hypothetical protein